ncbi:probable inactive linolenate hydroperoxide lyase [Hibiscus syriacus]|uniref:probable inactive linolenate hydroperoxide lyase n=1 Tax=Hibiscus syriacus TaxID=106335 RepID=UPI00192328CE|nr:probable inactive linolenate hydroperoxide lyase [Hibiscus syriacus]
MAVMVMTDRSIGDHERGKARTKKGELKNFALDILKRGSKVWVEVFFDTIECDISKNGSSSFLSLLQTFLSKSLIGADPTLDPGVADSGPLSINLWLGLQLLPTIPILAFQPLLEILLHSYAYPFALVSGGYRKLYSFIEQHGAIAGDKTGLQARLRDEVRKVCGSPAVKDTELVNSVVYEALRLNPPVQLQYARARKDFQLTSHDSVFDIKKGELLCGYQPLAMRDGKVLEEPESFKPDRFVGTGKELLNYLFWSNGPQTGSPSETNKQCAAKDYVTLSASLIVAHMYKRYGSISGDAGSITAVKKAN